MKKILSYTALLAAGMMTIIACEKQADKTATFTSASDMAFVNVIHASPNFRQVFNAPDSINVFINNNKVNGALITYGGTFPTPATSLSGYIALAPGLQNIKLTVAGRVTPDSIPLTTLSKIFSKGQKYSLIITDAIQNARDSSKILLPDVYTKPNPGSYSLRFVNAVSTDTAGTLVSVFSTRRNAHIFNSIAQGGVANFQSFPYNIQLNDTLYIRRPGSTYNLDTLNNVSFSNQRVYTLIYRGDGRTNVGTKARALVTYLHE
ncbi:DUF4397 domain-containing protein [Sediminibacterium sp.]|uniref:DUF4397 domain-containing protein n=1 Tax=Sediminibacterium sp. TaxID=1917865 RepID=UPI0025D9A5DE|nr:DUF4397 domain-containing protein [Sediminibacterium sp.]MBW0178138.1 DUF4397 domain-containing protein [Sediminibacterium sp.]